MGPTRLNTLQKRTQNYGITSSLMTARSNRSNEITAMCLFMFKNFYLKSGCSTFNR